MARVAVVLCERLGTWAAQLRPRLQDRPVRWFETRSAADLDAALAGVACARDGTAPVAAMVSPAAPAVSRLRRLVADMVGGS